MENEASFPRGLFPVTLDHMANMASAKGTKQWHSTIAKLKKADLEAIKKDFNSDDASFTTNKKQGIKAKSRKDLRKERRQEGKAKQHASWMKKRGIEVKKQEEEITKKPKKKGKKRKKNIKNAEKKNEGDLDNTDSQDLLAANENEDKLIASLEKKLGLKKRKNLPSKFREDGLDYLLEICEPVGNPALFMSDNDDNSDDERDQRESEDEPECASSKMRIGNSEKLKRESKASSEKMENENSIEEIEESRSEENLLTEESTLDEQEDDLDFEDEIEEDSDEDIAMGDFPSDEDDFDGSKDVLNKDVLNEEIVSLPKKSESGADTGVPEEKGEKYVPPHLRKLTAKSNAEEEIRLERLKKQLKGLLNRLSEANMGNISQEIEQVYSRHSKNDTSTALSKLLFDACIMPTHMPLKMLMEHMMLVAILHSNIGNEVGAFFIQSLVEKFNELHSETSKYLNGKECDNILMMTAQLYNFKVIDSLLMYDLIKELVKAFTERDIEMLMLLLKSIGPALRRDDPASLKEIILDIQAKAATCADLVKQSRVRFMLDVIDALRNNNLRKIPQYDPSLVENARKQMRAILKTRDSTGDMQLRVSLKDLLEAKNKGRWWVVGSAWAGRGNDACDDVKNLSETKEDNKLLTLAKKQRMNTELRKRIFCVVMSSEDYIDCFEKLLKMNLKDKQAREIIHVLIDCCLQEKMYNPYYAFLSQKLCEFSRSNQVTFQYSFWDRFKLISSSNQQSLENLAKLIAHLFASNALSISILKVVGFATIDKASVRFFLRLFTILLTEYPESTMKNVFGRIAPLGKLSLLREGLKIFLRHFILTKSSKVEGKIDNTRLKELVEIAEAALDGREVIKF